MQQPLTSHRETDSLGSLPSAVEIVEVGARDGLQNEAVAIPTDRKLRFIAALVAAGLRTVEVSSFVRGDRVPQLADASELFAALSRRRDVRYVALVPNPKGLERALAAGCREVAVFTAASETFNQKNINRSIDASLDDIRAVVHTARAEGLWVRGYISTAFGCPYEGLIHEDRVLDVVTALLETQVDEVSVGDTIGVATPRDVVRVVQRLAGTVPLDKLALHFHDTRGTALVNVLTALQLGVHIFDSSAGGLGGCPYAPGASGNLATEDLVYLLHGLGIATGVDLEQVRSASRIVAEAIGRPLPSRVYQAPPWSPQRLPRTAVATTS